MFPIELAQFTIVYVSVFVLMFDKLFPQFMLLFYLDDGFVISFKSFLVFSLVGLVLVGTQLTCAELT